MKKAEFIGKYYGTGYDRDIIYFEYKYRGYTYTICENRAKGNEPLSWQHKAEQDRIDKIIDAPETCGTKPFDINEIFDMLGWD